VLDGLLHPHSYIPYVQMGRSIALCTVSLLSRDSCERAFISQLMHLRFEYFRNVVVKIQISLKLDKNEDYLKTCIHL